MDPDLPAKMDTDPDAQPCQEKNPEDTGSETVTMTVKGAWTLRRRKRNKMILILRECLTAPI
jgi:hypothetical protein